MPIERTDLLLIKRAAAHYSASVEDLPRLAIPATRAVLDAAALASGLEVDTVYWITDEDRLAIATAPNAFTAMAKQSEAGGGGSSNAVRVALDFGLTFTDKASTIVTGQSWVTAASNISLTLLTPTGVDPDEMRLMGFTPVLSALTTGVGFTITLYSESFARGTYEIMCVGA